MQAVHLPGVPCFASLPIPGILLGMGDSENLLKQVMSVVRQGLLATQEAVGATQEAGAATAATLSDMHEVSLLSWCCALIWSSDSLHADSYNKHYLLLQVMHDRTVSNAVLDDLVWTPGKLKAVAAPVCCVAVSVFWLANMSY